MYQGIPPVFPPVHTLPSVSVRSVQASIPYRKFRYARYSPPYPTENLGIHRKSRYSKKNTESSVGVPVRPPYPTENLGTLGIDLHTLPKISVRSVQPSYPTEHLGIRRENTEISVGVSVQPPYLTENLGTLGTALHTLPKISVRSVQPSIPYRAYPYRTEHTLCLCVCMLSHLFWTSQTCGRTSRGHTGGRSHRIPPPFFCSTSVFFH